ncbi:MAG: response regulator [Verrucomicrobiota bacterium]
MSAIQVLLVDDVPEYLDTMELNLPEGCSARHASTSAEAKRSIENEAPAIAVVDVRLVAEETTNREGLELLSWIRTHSPGTKVLMISAYEEFHFEAESLANGALYFLRKPVQPEDFHQKVEQAMEMKA